MNTTLRKLLFRATAACSVLLSVSAQAQVPAAPIPLAGSAIGENSFTANWEPVAGATSYRLDVSTSPTFGTPAFASDLMITEYVEGGPGYKAVEIYNGTGADISLAGHSLRRQIDGTTSTIAMVLTGVIPSNSTRVYAYATGIAPDLQAVADQTSPGSTMMFDGNDVMILRRNIPGVGTVDIDAVGVLDQAADWGADMTLRRRSSVTGPTPNYSINDWDVYPMNDITGLGSHTIDDIPSFVPGYEDLTVNDVSQVVSGLAEGTTYYYRIRAVNDDGTSINSTPTIQVTTLAIPDAPVPLPGSTIGSNSFIANWEPAPGATSYRLDVSTSPTFGDPVVATDLIISEYIEGSAGYRAIEIYNGTGADVTLSGTYRLRKQQDGAPGVFDQQLLNGVLPNGATWVGTFAGPAAGIAAVADLTSLVVGGALDFDGNDALMLMKNGVAIDVVGVMDQAAAWGADMTLRRKSSVLSPTVNYSINDWDVYPMNDIADTGSHTMTTFIPSFVPGYEDLTVSGTSQLVSGLTPETDYYYRVRAVNADGTSPNSTPTIHVRTLALPTFGSIVQAPGIVCQDSAATFNLSGLTPNTIYAVSYTIDGGPEQVESNVLVDGLGNASFEVVLSLANNGQTLTVTAIQRTDILSEVVPVTTGNTVVLSVSANLTYYADTDSDGFGDPNITTSSCAAVPGFVLDNTDCDDTATGINPGATEILYNGIDENCDGNLDEGSQYVTQVQAAQCGGALPTIISNIFATPLPQVSMYRFEVTDVETLEVQTIERVQNYFQIPMLASFHYNKTYSVRVMVQRNGVWLGYYGPTCNVSTPYVLGAGGAAAVNPSQCGNVIPTISTLISTTSLAHVTGYRFRVTNVTDPSAPNQVQVIDRTLHWFALTMLANFNYGTTYTVEVAIRTTGDYSDYGSPCSVTTPPVPSLVNCGATIAAETSIIATASLDRVSMYRFTVTNAQTQEATVIDNPLHWFRFNQIPDYVPAAPYNVTVAVMTAGHYSLVGTGCEITAPDVFARTVIKDGSIASGQEDILFDAKAYPNPFSRSFSIVTTTASQANFAVKVYDMTGRLIEDLQATPSDMQTLILGESYPAGVYNVILTQGVNVKTIRMIKR